MVGGSSNSRSSSSTFGEPRISVKVENSDFTNQLGSVAIRVLPIKVDGGMECLSDGDVPVPPTPILAAPHIESGVETRLALIAPAESSNDADSTVVVSGGQVFVISDASSLTTTAPRPIQRTAESNASQRVACREEKRRVSHNEVERRRRDKINSWICKLAKILPDGSEIQARNNQSKGGILAKACDYIEELRSANERLTEEVLSVDKDIETKFIHLEEIQILKRENNALKNENALLRARLEQHGILASDINS